MSVAITPQAISAQEKPPSTFSEQLSRVGVFFRADTPFALRNHGDPFLPIYLEVINGVEKTAHSTGITAAQYLTRAPLQLEGVNVYVKPASKTREFVSEPLLMSASKDFTLDLRTDGKPLSIADRMQKTLEVPREQIDSFLKKHFIGGPFGLVDVCVTFRVVGWPSQNFYLRVRLDAPALPAIPKWYRGDVHYHCAYTDNPAERGYPLSVTKQAALDSALDWLILTDHSTDLTPERYEGELREVSQYRDGRLVMIRGEEITASSGKPGLLTTVHMLALPSPDDPDRGFPDPKAPSQGSVISTGDGSPSSAAIPLGDALERIASSGGFAYAAHPFDPVSPIVRGGSWDLAIDFLAPAADRLQAGLLGLEPWNRATTETADDARDPLCIHKDADPTGCFQPDPGADQYARLEKAIGIAWTPLLVKGLQSQTRADDFPSFKVFVAAGSDSHGDLNYEATMDVVDFLAKPSRALSGYAENNAMGKVATVAYCPAGMGPRGENVLRALRDGRSVVTNGPILIAGLDRNGNGALDDPEDVGIGQAISSPLKSLPPLQIQWASSVEFGPVSAIRLIVGTSQGESQPEEISVPAAKGRDSQGSFSVDLQSRFKNMQANAAYIRLETRTRNNAGEEFRCYTNPIWVRLTER